MQIDIHAMSKDDEPRQIQMENWWYLGNMNDFFNGLTDARTQNHRQETVKSQIWDMVMECFADGIHAIVQ